MPHPRRTCTRESGRNAGARLPVFRRESGRDGPSFLPTSKTPLRGDHAGGSVQHGTNGTEGQKYRTRHPVGNKLVMSLPCNSRPKAPHLPCGQVRARQAVCRLPAFIQALPKCPEGQHGARFSMPYGQGTEPCRILTFSALRPLLLTFDTCALPPLQCKPGKSPACHDCRLLGLSARSCQYGPFYSQSVQLRQLKTSITPNIGRPHFLCIYVLAYRENCIPLRNEMVARPCRDGADTRAQKGTR